MFASTADGNPYAAAMTAEPQRFPFSEVTRLSPTAEGGRFAGEVHPEWTIAGRPNGGYLLAMLARAAVAVSSHSDPIAASAMYVRAPESGPVTVEAELLREGRSTSQVRARLLQSGQSCVEAMLAVSELRPDVTPHWQRGLPQAHQTPFETCTPLVPPSQGGNRVALQAQIDARLEPLSAGFLRGEPAGSGELWGWLALYDEPQFDPISLLFALDAFPPGTFDLQPTGWVPTLELTAYIRALPAPGPVRILQRAQLIDDGRFDELCYVWDATGRLVAQATQLAGIRFG
jgi:acyl-coenzyme A thioesterase PaaI-like protein